MSASPIARQSTNCQSIPTRSVLNDASQLPTGYSSTPGGTLYSTTPGGTRIVYDRAVIMGLRNSPAARTPPKNLSGFPDLIKNSPYKSNGNVIPSPTKKDIIVEEVQEQFQMDM